MGKSAVKSRLSMMSDTIEKTKNAALNNASHFTLIGITKNNLTVNSGNRVAKAKNMERFKKLGERFTETPTANHTINP